VNAIRKGFSSAGNPVKAGPVGKKSSNELGIYDMKGNVKVKIIDRKNGLFGTNMLPLRSLNENGI